MKAKSDARVKNWGNTIDALRLKKEKAREERIQQEELERQKIDAEEAEIQAEYRRQQIAKANYLLYQQEDRVKKFNSKALLNDVLNERKLQEEIHKQRLEMEKEMEQEWKRKVYDDVDKLGDEKVMEYTKRRESAKATQDEQKKQIVTCLEKKKSQEKEIEEYAQVIKQQAQKDMNTIRQERETVKRKKVDLKNQLDLNVHEKELKVLKQKEQELDVQARNVEFLAKKQQQAELALQKEVEKERIVAENKERILDRHAKVIKKKQEQQQTFLQKQQDDAEKKRLQELQKKRERQEKMEEQIAQATTMQLRIKEDQKRKQEVEKKQFSELVKMQAELILEEENEARLNKLVQNKNTQRFQQLQMKQNARKKQQEKDKIRDEAEALKQAQLMENLRFENYMTDMLDEAQSKTADNTLLQTTAAKMVKS